MKFASFALASACALFTFSASASIVTIDFESGFTDQQEVGQLDSVVSVSVGKVNNHTKSGFIGKSGGPVTGFAPKDRTPDGSDFFLTDEKNGPKKKYDYFFDFNRNIEYFGLDLYDYRADGGARAGDFAMLSLYDYEGGSILGNAKVVVPKISPDPNMLQLDVWIDPSMGATFAALTFSRGDVGTAVDNLRYKEVPEPAMLALFGLALFSLGFKRRR